MKSLFWKIFVSFWLSLVLFATLTLWTTSHYLESVRARSHEQQPRYHFLHYLDQLQQVASHQGSQGVKQWLQSLDQREAIPYLLIDEKGNDFLGRPVPLRLQQRVIRYEQRLRFDDDEHEHQFRRPHLKPVIIDGNRYRLVADFQSITLGRVLNRPRVIAIPVLLAMLISGVMCFLLARYLTLPLSRLRQASRKVAAGDLAQRVSPSMGKRQDEIAELARDFDYMAEQLQLLINSHKQLLRDASHELRSPLARLQVALGLAQQRNGNQDSAELERIEREAERLNQLIGQLLSLARLDTGQLTFDMENIDLSELLETIASDAAYEAHSQQREVQLLENTPVQLKANRTLLHSALENVIRNAIRYTKEHTSVDISSHIDARHPGEVVIQIRDRGPGIPEDMLQRIFEPFVRVGEARDRAGGGYGLGLAIARRAINLHGGHMLARNESDNGMSVFIHLPIKKGG